MSTESATVPSRSPRRLPSIGLLLQEYGILVALLVLAVVLAAQSDVFLTKTNLLNIADQMAIVGIMAVGMTVLLVSGSFDLSVGSILGLGGALAIGLSSSMPLSLAVGIALLAGAAIGLTNGVLVAKAGINSLIVTLGTLSTVRGIVLLYGGGESVTGGSTWLIEFANGRPLFLPNTAWLMLALAAVATIVMKRTTVGRYIEATGGNPDAAELAGVNVDAYRIGAFVAMGVLAAFAGVLFAGRLGTIDPTAGAGLELDVIAAVIIGGTSLFGGKGAIWKSLIGVALLATLTNGFNLLNVDPYWQYVVKGLVIIVSVALYTRKAQR